MVVHCDKMWRRRWRWSVALAVAVAVGQNAGIVAGKLILAPLHCVSHPSSSISTHPFC